MTSNTIPSSRKVRHVRFQHHSIYSAVSTCNGEHGGHRSHFFQHHSIYRCDERRLERLVLPTPFHQLSSFHKFPNGATSPDISFQHHSIS